MIEGITKAVTMIVTAPQTKAVAAIPVMPVNASTHGEIKSRTPKIPWAHSIDCIRGIDKLTSPAIIVRTPSTISVVVVFPSVLVQIGAKAAYKPASTATQFCHVVHVFIDLTFLYKLLTAPVYP